MNHEQLREEWYEYAKDLWQESELQPEKSADWWLSKISELESQHQEEMKKAVEQIKELTEYVKTLNPTDPIIKNRWLTLR